MNNYSKELYNLMEDEYRKRGASNNCAQLIMRGNHLDNMVNLYGEEAVKEMLLNDFDAYHFHEAKADR